MTCAHLFAGVGGFGLAAEWMGWQNVLHCEIDPFCKQILQFYWPDAEFFGDIKQTDFNPFLGRIDLLTGGFPCQPFSAAGKRGGTADDRYLWPEMLRCVREMQPRWIVAENVSGIYTSKHGLVFEIVCADLENEGYEVQAFRVPACATGAPHRRDRWWFVAYSDGGEYRCRRGEARKEDGLSNDISRRYDGRSNDERQEPADGNGTSANYSDAADPDGPRPQKVGNGEIRRGENGIGESGNWTEPWTEAATRLCRMDDGLPGRLDREAVFTKEKMKKLKEFFNKEYTQKHAAGKWRSESLKAYGNAIVPQVAFEIYKAIQKAENDKITS